MMRAPTALAWGLIACLLVPALTLTVLRLTQPLNALVLHIVALTPVALPLYLVALALLLVQVTRGRGPHAAWLLVVIAAVGLGLHAWWFAPQVTGTHRVGFTGAQETTVMAANLLAGAGDSVELLEVADAEDVDLLVVVEITPEALLRMERAGLDDLFGHRAGEPANGPGGTMVFSRAPLSRAGALPTRFGSWHLDVANGLTVVATHPRAPTSPRSWLADHDVILTAVIARRPDLVVGDLNATSDHRPLRRLAAEGYRDAAELSNQGWQPTWPANHLGPVWLAALPPLARIDHVLVGPTMTARSSRTVRLAGTDHLAVIAQVVRSSP